MTATVFAWDTEPVPRRPPYGQGPDEWAAWRVRYEREKKGWSQGELARHVADAGVPMQQQAIWKIENGQPPRKISLTEAIAFGQVFDIEATALAQPLEVVSSELVREIREAIADLAQMQGPLIRRLRDVRRLPPDSDVWPELLQAMRDRALELETAIAETDSWLKAH